MTDIPDEVPDNDAPPEAEVTEYTKPPELPLEAARRRLRRHLPPPDEHPPLSSVPQGGTPGRKAQKQQAYLEAYANSRNVRASALRAGVSREIVYRWRKSRAFIERELKAEQDYLDSLRAQVDSRSRTSDALLMFRAKALLPEFKETLRTEHVVEGGMPVRFTLNIGDAAPEEESQGTVEVKHDPGHTNGGPPPAKSA